MNIYAGVTFYYPSLETINYVVSLKNVFEKIIIFDNSERPDPTILNVFADRNKYIYRCNNQNLGLSKAFNYMIRTCIDENVNYLMLFDQDSCFDIDIVNNFIIKLTSIEELYRRNTMIFALKTYFYDEDIYNMSCLEELDESNFVISSGSCLNISLVAESNILYDENLFIDHIDFDFCKRIIQNNYKILILNKFFVKQQLGYKYKNRICYSPIRFYYFTRDRLYLNRRDYSFPLYIFYNFKSLCYILFKKIIMNEDKKLLKLKYFVLGFIDYNYKKNGCYSRKKLER